MTILPSLTSTDGTPSHVAIIMDGNGRWARARGLPRAMGHQRGVDAVRRTVRAAGDMGIGYLTLFGFSSENWHRPATEVGELMGLLRRYLSLEIAELHRQGVRLRIVGDRERLARDIVDLVEHAEALTADNTGLRLTVALSYGGRDEIVVAARRLAERARSGTLDPVDIDEATFESELETGDLPPPDLLIRTSGEKRISNFLLWHCAYSEFVFLDVLWPDFDAEHLELAVREFACRDRRFGKVAG